jgi:glutamate/aspartate transport system substrate-binding protein
MKRLHLIGLALAAGLCAGQAGAAELTGTLKKIKETGTITIGYRDSSIPFSYLDDNQKPIGFAIDICLRIVDAVKSEFKLDKLAVEFNPVTSSTRIPLLANGTIDLECGSTTNNPDRLKQVAFTNTHFLTATRFVSKKALKLNSIDDLKGKSVASTSGTTNIKQLTEANAARNLGINIIPAKEHAESFLMVETDRAVAAVLDDILLASFVAGIQGSRRLCHLHGRIFKTRALRHHAAQGRSGLQEGRRCRDCGPLSERRGSKAVRQVVHAEDPAQGIEPQHPDRRRAEA